nr:hypothetical protein [Streptomyces inhibens]
MDRGAARLALDNRLEALVTQPGALERSGVMHGEQVIDSVTWTHLCESCVPQAVAVHATSYQLKAINREEHRAFVMRRLAVGHMQVPSWGT